MNRLTWLVLVGVMILVSCAPASNLAPTNSAPPPPPPTLTTVPEASSEAPTLVPVSVAGPQAGTTMTWLDGSQLAYVPAGDFIMGMGIGNTPQKTIALDPYWIYLSDVTNKMYVQCVATGNCAPPAAEIGTPPYTNPDYGDYPVVGVTWDMAANYCKWVQGALPTEAQWEKAARGSSGAVYPWGNDTVGCDLANYKGCEGHTTAVNTYPTGRSPYGLFDMAGNVFQWVSDYYAEQAYNDMPASNPTGPSASDTRVVRGSSFETEADQTLSAIRHFGAPAFHSRDTGFRCVVQQPKAIAPFCQSGSYIPTGSPAATGTCQVPQADVRGNYCAGKAGYTTVQISQDAEYTVQTSGYSCSDAVVDGKRVLTCTGPDKSSGEVTVCNASCSTSPTQTGATPACDPGYAFDSGSGACVYSPASLQLATGGCPPGYNVIDRGGQKVCAVGLNLNGQCPLGTYFDGQYGGCISPTAPDAPYGINDTALASTAFQGCAAGYNYDAQNQCCQAASGGAYPGCQVGFKYDDTQKTCVPNQVRMTGPGCVTVTVNLLRCSQPADICSKITQEPVCLRNSYACTWNSRNNTCVAKKP
ncbi:MAG TPA: formylglycine-generating enzyme family protein [Anaerolineales bacterium]|nr:formylglycine-generating enzyme family protein [Anaerolineales bacterium]